MHIIYRGNQAEYGIHILAVAPQEYVNSRTTIQCVRMSAAKQSYDDDCFAALSEHGDAANADCGEERDY